MLSEVYFWKLKWELAEWGEAKWQSEFLYVTLKAEFPRLAEKRNKCFLGPGGSAFPKPEWFILNSDSSLKLLNQESNDSFIMLRRIDHSELQAVLRLKILGCCREYGYAWLLGICTACEPCTGWLWLKLCIKHHGISHSCFFGLAASAFLQFFGSNNDIPLRLCAGLFFIWCLYHLSYGESFILVVISYKSYRIVKATGTNRSAQPGVEHRQCACVKGVEEHM